MITLVPGSVSLLQWQEIYQGAAVELDQRAQDHVDRSAEFIRKLAESDQPIYGVNTGFGKLASVRIDKAELDQLQYNIVVSHATGVGAPTPVAVVRLMMALKLASLGLGASGVRWGLLKTLESMIRHDIYPIVPQQGSVGASGDLAPLAHMTLAMIGLGQVSYRGELTSAADAFAKAGIQKMKLTAKEGLALLNGTQFSTAYALAALFRASTVFQSALITGALSTDAGKGSDAPFDDRIHRLRPHRGQSLAAKALRELMAHSQIRRSHLVGDPRVQDPYCLRCQPQVMGAVFDQLGFAARTFEIESNSVSDNPLVMVESSEVLSGGNFHAEPIAMVCDGMAVALCELGSLAERRIAMLVDSSISGLPPFLSPRAGLHSGFMIPQVTAAALVSENKQMGHPASIDSIPTSANQEDHVSMAPQAARRLHPMLDHLQSIVGIELLVACQACDFHQPLRSSRPLERVRALVRGKIPALDEDRYLSPEMALASDWVARGMLIGSVEEVALPDCLMTSEVKA